MDGKELNFVLPSQPMFLTTLDIAQSSVDCLWKTCLGQTHQSGTLPT